MSSAVERDERTVVVEKASNSAAYIFVSFALLLDVAYRAFTKGEAAFDLLAIVILGGLVSTVYQARHKVLGRGWVKTVVLAVATSALIAVMIAALR